MPNIQPITKAQYAAKRWKRYAGYHFAAKDAVVSLVMQELPKAQLTLPIGFALKDEQAFPVAVQSLQPGINLFVAADGRWRGRYVPAAYRGYPFILADTQDGKQVLCIDEDSALVSETEGEEFFNQDGEPSKPLADVLNFLQQVYKDRQRTFSVCSLLQKHALLKQWPLKSKNDEDGEEKHIEGLYCVDEKALNTLEYEAYAEISQAGGMALAYCQLLSMQHLQDLIRLHTTIRTQAASAPEVPDVDKIFGEKADNDMFKFDF